MSPRAGGARFSVLPPSPGAYIRGRFTQQDVDHRAVVYVIPPEVEVTNDSFRFRPTDPAGNSASPDTWVSEVFVTRRLFSCLLLISVPQTGSVLVPGPALRHLLQNL